MRKYVLASVFFLLAEVAGAQTKASPTLADNPGKQNTSHAILPELKLSGTVPAVFATLVREAGLSGGVATRNPDCSHGPEISISVPAGTSFEKVLRQIADSKTCLKGDFEVAWQTYFLLTRNRRCSGSGSATLSGTGQYL